MKKTLLTIFASVWAAAAIGQTSNYSFTVPTGGCISIADNFYFGNNTLEQLFPGVNGMLTVYKWNAASQGYVTYNYDPFFAGWDPPGGTLKPGEGAFIENPNTFPLTFTFTGAIQPPPARTRLPAGFYLVGCPRPQACPFDELMGFPPVPGDQILFYNQNCSSNTSTHTFTAAGGWTPSVPVLAVGKAAFVKLQEPLPYLTSVMKLGKGALRFAFTNTTARNYSVLATTNVALTLSNWVNLGSAASLGAGRYEFTDPAATNYPRRFYMLRAP